MFIQYSTDDDCHDNRHAPFFNTQMAFPISLYLNVEYGIVATLCQPDPEARLDFASPLPLEWARTVTC